MSDFYKMFPAKWDFGTASLSLEEEAAYLRIVNAIHKHDAPVPDNDRVLAGLFRVSTRKARSLIEALVVAEKLTIANGEIWNERAKADLTQRGMASASAAERGAKGGKARAEKQAVGEQFDTGSQSVRDHFADSSGVEVVTNQSPTDSEAASNQLNLLGADQANASSRIEKNREEERIEKEEAIASSKKADRGSRLPSGWTIPEEYRESAKEMGASDHLIASEADRFRDYWIAKAGKDGVKLDWLATWRNWVRRKLDDPRSKPSDMSEARRRAAAEEAERHRAAVEVGKQNYGKEPPAPKPQISEKMRLQVQRDLAEMRAAASLNPMW